MSPSLPFSSPTAAAAAIFLSTALVACSGAAPPDPLACTERAQCPADAFCRAGSCVQSAAPVARIARLSGEVPRSNRVLAFDASASADPDVEDRVERFAWRTRAVSAACEATVVEADAAAYRVLFPCAGEFLVEVTVTDSTGFTSAPATLELQVVADEVPGPALRVGSALILEHRCAGEPLVCTPLAQDGATTFSLEASVTSASVTQLRWAATPPPGISEPHSVTFSDASAPTPTVTLRTSGGIAGTWTFTAVATDADGRAAIGEQRVTIGNRAPVLAEPVAAVAVHHRYLPDAAAYEAQGVAAARFVDPDGDPLTLAFAGESSGAGDSSFTVLPGGGFAISVPAAAPQQLIGDGVSRRIAVTAADVNGGRAGASVPVTVLNRPPRIAVPRSMATVPHRYDAERRVYSASMTLSDYVDDDGDPIAPGSTYEQVPAGCSSLGLAGATLSLTCEVPLSTVAALATLVRPHVLDVTVRDAWAHSARAAARLDVTNQPPRVTTTYTTVRTPGARGDTCCWWDHYEDDCGKWPERFEAGAGSFSALVDPDGDPLDVSYSTTSTALVLSRPSATACVGADCAVGLASEAVGSITQCVVIPELGPLRVSATDGAASVDASLSVWRN